MFEQILQQPQIISGAVALTVVAITLYKSGLLHAWADKIANNGNKTARRLEDLEEFMKTAESNHFTDLDEVIKEVHSLREKVNNIDKRLAVVESKIDK